MGPVLTPHRAGALIHDAVGFTPVDLRPLGEGWHTAVFTAGPDVWRLAKNPAYTPHLNRGRQILNDLTALPRIPRVRWWGVGQGHGVLGYRRLPGERRPPSSYGPDEANQVGHWLTLLHDLDPDVLSVPVLPWAQRVEEARRHLERDLIPELPGLLVSRLRRELGLAERLAAHAPPVILHTDLNPEHLLFEGAKLGGVVDFDDVAVGDPAWDLRLFVHTAGPDWTKVLLDAYGATSDRTFWARVTTYARISPAFEMLGATEERRTEGAKRLAQTLS